MTDLKNSLTYYKRWKNLRSGPLTPEKHAEIQSIMQDISDDFFEKASGLSIYPFITLSGLINEYIKLCHHMMEEGLDYRNHHKFFTADEKEKMRRAAPDFLVDFVFDKLTVVFGPFITKELARRVYEKYGNESKNGF